jgi:hypothetical protein
MGQLVVVVVGLLYSELQCHVIAQIKVDAGMLVVQTPKVTRTCYLEASFGISNEFIIFCISGI